MLAVWLLWFCFRRGEACDLAIDVRDNAGGGANCWRRRCSVPSFIACVSLADGCCAARGRRGAVAAGTPAVSRKRQTMARRQDFFASPSPFTTKPYHRFLYNACACLSAGARCHSLAAGARPGACTAYAWRVRTTAAPFMQARCLPAISMKPELDDIDLLRQAGGFLRRQRAARRLFARLYAGMDTTINSSSTLASAHFLQAG